MRKTIALGSVLAALAFVAPHASAQSQIQQPGLQQQPGAGSASGKFCLQPKAGGALNCTYQTMAQCQQASSQGSAGNCVENPRATTGSAPLEKKN